MSFTTFSGPIRAGTARDNPGRNTGLVVLSQSYDSGDMTGFTVGNLDAAVMVLPAGSLIVDIVVDQGTASTTGTTTISVGNATGGAQLMAAVATTAGGRFRGTATAATQAAWTLSTSADTTVYVRNATGTATLGAGRYTLTVLYVQRSPAGLANPATS
jgi:hypothetical protein